MLLLKISSFKIISNVLDFSKNISLFTQEQLSFIPQENVLELFKNILGLSKNSCSSQDFLDI